MLTDSPVVNEITQINFSGNIIPISWFKHVKFKNNKPDLLGIMILSEIIYWYRAREERDESTGQIKGYKKKFEADMLQRSYQSFADQFGVSKKQVQEAIYRLRDNGFIVVELRNIVTETKQTLANVTFLAPVPQAIYEITYPSPFQKGDVSLSKGRRVPLEGETYTENTTENTTDINNILFFEPTETKTEDDSKERILSFWNSLRIIVHRQITPEISKAIDKALKKWDEETITEAIRRYGIVYHDTEYFFKHKWKLENFLTQKNALPDFLDEGEKWQNYLSSQRKTNPHKYAGEEAYPDEWD